MRVILILISCISCCGCNTVKQMEPNNWNMTYYEPIDGNRGGETIAVGVSGALPFGKQ